MSRARANLFSVLVETFSIFGLLLTVLILVLGWNLLPSHFPIHFGLDGNPQSNGNHSDAILLFLLSLGIYLGLSVLQRIPEKFNYPWSITEENREDQFRLARHFVQVLKLETVWIFTLIMYIIASVGTGIRSSVPYYFIPVLNGRNPRGRAFG